MYRAVLDASALVAILRRESGAADVIEWLRGAVVSSVNVAEVLWTMDKRGADRNQVEVDLRQMQFRELPFTREDAEIVARLQPLTLGSSVGFADRSCMALAFRHGVPAITGDREWLKHDVGVEIKLFRNREAA